MQILKALRQQKGLSQAKLAARADLNPVTIWRIETGQRSPTVEQLEKIAGAMDLEVADFFPKVQLPLSLEDKKKTAGEVIAEVIAVKAGEWIEQIEGGWANLGQDERDSFVGKTSAALELRDELHERIHIEDLIDAGEFEELAEVRNVLNRVVNEFMAAMEKDLELSKDRIAIANEEKKELEAKDEQR